MVRAGRAALTAASTICWVSTETTPHDVQLAMARQPAGEWLRAGCWDPGAHGVMGPAGRVPSCAAWVAAPATAPEWSAVHTDPAPSAAYCTAISVRTPETTLRQIMIAR